VSVRWSGLRDGASKPAPFKIRRVGTRKFNCVCLGGVEGCATRLQRITNLPNARVVLELARDGVLECYIFRRSTKKILLERAGLWPRQAKAFSRIARIGKSPTIRRWAEQCNRDQQGERGIYC
jgi:hypothetical protein